MTTSISIHPQTSVQKLKFSCDNVSYDNANAITMKFSSMEYHDREKVGVFDVLTEVTAFHLDYETAACLSALGRMTLETRAKILPAMINALDEQEETE